MTHYVEKFRSCFKELKEKRDDWKSVTDTYRGQIGDEAFKSLMKGDHKSNTNPSVSTVMERLVKSGKIAGPIGSVLSNPSSGLSSYMYGDIPGAYVSLLSSYLRMMRNFRADNRDYKTDITKLHMAEEMSINEAQYRIDSIWSGYGNAPVILEIATKDNLPNTYFDTGRRTTFYVSKSFFRKAHRFPERNIESMGPIGFESIEDDGEYRSALAFVFRQHLKRGVDSSYKSSISKVWIAYNPGLSIYATSEKSREASINLLKKRTIAAIDKKLKGG